MGNCPCPNVEPCLVVVSQGYCVYCLCYSHRGTVVSTRYGSASGQIWLDGVQCVGTETSLGECNHKGWGVHSCDHSDDVSLSCGTSPVQYGNINTNIVKYVRLLLTRVPVAQQEIQILSTGPPVLSRTL